MNELLAVLICLFGGLTGGLVGVGGGVLFVPALTVFIGLTQVEAESTSLLMIVDRRDRRRLPPERLRQRPPARGADRSAPSRRSGCWSASPLANHVSERALQLSFAALALFMAAQLVRRARSA